MRLAIRDGKQRRPNTSLKGRPQQIQWHHELLALLSKILSKLNSHSIQERV
jgi:hypothetical protein